MKKTKKHVLIALAFGLVLASCSTDEIKNPSEQSLEMDNRQVQGQSSNFDNAISDGIVGNLKWRISGKKVQDFSYDLNNAVIPSECDNTPFSAISSYYRNAFINGFIANWDGNPDAIGVILDDYFVINQIAALDENKNADTFGAKGEYTNYVKKDVRSLEKFWDMPNLITVRGQHTSTLEDLDFIRFIYENYSNASPAEVDYLVSIAEHFNTASDQIPENPFFAADGFATSNGFIVIGDGIVSMLSETGLDPKVVWSSILAHEWSHQIQFENINNWDYPVPAFNGTPESTRMTELEADFLTGYYLTHKRGGTYNWKRIEDVLSAFYNIGDCGFENPGHHGTPNQRIEAARQGYLYAANQQKKGHISAPKVVHEAFISRLPSIVGL